MQEVYKKKVKKIENIVKQIGTLFSADLGGSSKYLSGNLKD